MFLTRGSPSSSARALRVVSDNPLDLGRRRRRYGRREGEEDAGDFFVDILDEDGEKVGGITGYDVDIEYDGSQGGRAEDDNTFWLVDGISPSGTEVHEAIVSSGYATQHELELGVSHVILIDTFHVRKSVRGKGFGRAALATLLNWLGEKEAARNTHVFLYVHQTVMRRGEKYEDAVERLVRFYASLGFERLGETDVMGLGLDYHHPFCDPELESSRDSL
jgi:GNAT superfamily N-acetyltransferase